MPLLQSGCSRDDSGIASVKSGTHQKDGGDAAYYLGEVLSFFGKEWTSKKGEFAVGEPLLEDLVAAEGVGPDIGGDGGPQGVAVEIDIDAGVAEEGEGLVEGEGFGGGEGGELFAFGFGPVSGRWDSGNCSEFGI